MRARGAPLRSIGRNRRVQLPIRIIGIATVLVASFIVMPLAVDAVTSPTSSGFNERAINGHKFGVNAPIHVLTFSGPQYSLAIDLANHEIDGGLETPSSMCRSTVGCVAAVNGDFFDVPPSGRPDPGDEVGGIIQNCVLLHTPEVSHEQVDLDGQRVTEGLNWGVSVDVNGVVVPITAVNQELPMKYSGVNLHLTGTLLFTAPYALVTPSAAGRVTYEFIEVSDAPIPTTTVPTTTSSTTSTTSPTTTTTSPTTTTTIPTTNSPTTINSSAELELVGETTGAVRVRTGHVDISAPAGSPIGTLQVGNNVIMTTTSAAGCNNIGGHPILLNDGAVLPINRSDVYLTQRYARTVVGWTASGQTVLMIVGGVDGRTGATASQLDRLLRSIHVVTALDLDGGDSTVLYVKGHIYYHAGRS